MCLAVSQAALWLLITGTWLEATFLRVPYAEHRYSGRARDICLLTFTVFCSRRIFTRLLDSGRGASREWVRRVHYRHGSGGC